MKKTYSIILFLIIFISVSGSAYAGTLSCSITTAAACTGGTNTIILRMSGTTNAHTELPGQANYTGSVVCCSGVTGLSNACVSPQATVVKLSGVTNAHIEQNSQANYANLACISVPTGGSVSVGYQATNCTGFDTTIGSMSGTINAHVGDSAAYPATQICASAAGGAAPAPVITSYTNTTDTALNSTNCATTGCGARIGSASFVQSVTITGTDFGADPGAANRSTATNNIKIGTHQIANANVTAWSNTSITFLTDSSVTGDTDTDWGVNFGGTAAIKVTAGSQVSTGTDFYVFPQVTSISVPGGFPAESAREYDAGDTDGIITLNGTRFGTAQGSGSATLVGQTATPTVWNNTGITLQVPTTIVDTTNTGAISMTQGTGANGKTTTYLNTLRVLPRITSFNPVNAIVGAAVTVNGNHFCQTGTCPGSFSAADKVTFTSGVVATTFTSWSATAIVTAVPTGAVTGTATTTSATSYTSNGKSFTVDANTTTLATGSDPAATTIAPSASAADVDLFTLQTNGGTEAVTSVTVNLSTNSGVLRLAITDNANTELGFTTSPATGSNVITVSGLTAGTGVTTFKVRVTPLSHASMPAPAGASYAITAPVTAFAGPNIHAGSDTNTNALTIDNLSPANVTSSTATAGDTQVSLAWTNPVDSDFHSTIVLRRTTSVVTDVPVEGTTYTVGNTIGASTVACVVATPTAVCTDSGLTNGVPYYYKIFAKDSRVNYSVTGVVPTGSPVTPIATQTLTVGISGTQATTLNSNSTAQHIGGAGTAAFTLQINNGTSNVTSVKVSDTGTIAIANLTNPKLYYETGASCTYNGNESNVAGSAPVGETITFTLPSVAVGVGSNMTCLYFVSDISSSAVGGQTIDLQITNPSTDVVVSSGVNTDTVAKAIAGTTTILPQITGYTNSTESGLNYSAACTGCGARIGGGSGFMHTIVISGYGFGADPGVGSRDTSTNKVEVVGASTNLIDDIGAGNTNVTAWSNTSITITTDSSITGDTDTSWGTNFGGAASLKVTAGGQAVPTNLNFYIFPQITSITQPAGFPADSAREYDAGDTDGVITLNGTRFGSSQGTGSSTVLTQTATINSWNNTAIALQVPTAISDSVYTGSVVMTQGTGGNSKTHSYNPLRILPRITSLVPSTGSIGDAMTANGNHFCQTGTCPVAFDASNKITFANATDATVFTSWSHTAIATQVPTGAVTGNATTTSNAYTSNGSNFTLASAVPYNPTSLGQFRDAGFTQSISIGGVASSTPIYLKMTMEVGVSGGTLTPQFEYKAIGTSFVCTGTAVCASDAVSGASIAGPGPTTGTTSISVADNVYHWQARVKHTKNSVDYYSSWISFGGNAETATDFQMDTTAPAVTLVSSGSPGTNSVTITWSTASEISTSQVQYNKTGTFVANCATNNDCTAITDTSPMVNSHSVSSISNLDSGTLYYYRVRSKDAAGNETIDSNNSFTTQIIAVPAKTVKQYINGATGSVSGATTYYFTVNAPEVTPTVQSAYIEVVGIVSGGFSGTITVQANSATSRAYTVSTAASTPTLYRFMYPINSPNTETNLNLNDVAPCSNSVVPGTAPLCNKVVLTPSTGSIDVLSAKIITTYSYTP